MRLPFHSPTLLDQGLVVVDAVFTIHVNEHCIGKAGSAYLPGTSDLLCSVCFPEGATE